MIDVLLYCQVPQIEIAGIAPIVSRSGKLAALPHAGDLIHTDSGATPLDPESEPAIEVLGVVHNVDDGTATVYCVHTRGDWLSALDLICLDGWECEADEDDAYREACHAVERAEAEDRAKRKRKAAAKGDRQ